MAETDNLTCCGQTFKTIGGLHIHEHYKHGKKKDVKKVEERIEKVGERIEEDHSIYLAGYLQSQIYNYCRGYEISPSTITTRVGSILLSQKSR